MWMHQARTVKQRRSTTDVAVSASWRLAKHIGGCRKIRNSQNFRNFGSNSNKIKLKRTVGNSLKMSYIHETHELLIR
jgi:hypothetical protein